MSNAAAGGAAACSRHAGGVQLGHAGAMQVGRAVSTVGEGGAAAFRRECRRHAGGTQAGRRGMQAGHAGGRHSGGPRWSTKRPGPTNIATQKFNQVWLIFFRELSVLISGSKIATHNSNLVDFFREFCGLISGFEA